MDGKELIKLGFQEGPSIGVALARIRELEKKGCGKDDILQQIDNLRKETIPKLNLRDKPLEVEVAALSTNEEETQNIEASLKKMEELSLCPVITRCALMPDTCPSGQEFGCIPVGGAIETKHHIIPSAHSADVCCSMRVTFFESERTIKELANNLSESTHFGPFGRKEGDYRWNEILEEDVWDNPFLKGLEASALTHLQTQGDGNHFSYIGLIDKKDSLMREFEEEGYYQEAENLGKIVKRSSTAPLYAIVSHHGSRKLGAQIYKRGLEAAIKETKKIASNIPKTMAWLDMNTEIGLQYWEALQYAKRWTEVNHQMIHQEFTQRIKARPVLKLGNAHNFVWKTPSGIAHGKGATPAWKDEKGRNQIGIIPLNMASPILITFGGNNKNYLSFSPHGAGRNKSRSAVLKDFMDPKTKKIDELKVAQAIAEQTKGIEVLWASKKADLSESPLAYKSAEEICKQLEMFKLARIATTITPKASIMAGEFEMPWKKRKELKKSKEETLIL
jgi:tRNA-splicing ligase RtcB